MTGATQGDLFVVMKLPGFATRDDGLWSLGGADGTWSQFDGTNRVLTEDFGRSYRTSVGVPVAPLTDYVVYNVSAQTDDWRVRLNSALQSAETTNTVVFGTSGALGRNAYYDYLQGDIAEIIAYDRVLSDRQREDVSVYLNEKYGLNLRDRFGAYRDFNGDGLTDDVDRALGFDPYNLDLDGDGIANAVERTNGTSPFKADTDGDGVADNLDPYPLDPTRPGLPPAVPGDVTPPTITLTRPANATPLP
jgi:hypothetical protein